MKKIIILLVGLFATIMTAQTIEVKGVVTDSNNQPLPGATVTVKNYTDTGTSVDFEGNYSIEVKKGQKLVYSYIGFTSEERIVDKSIINVSLSEGVALDNVVLLGSRNPNRTATDTPVPVDVISMSELRTSIPQTNLNQIMNYVAPSFTSNVQNIADGTDHIDPASLRGLGPDQVLVLINGKRRHTSSLINVNGTFGRGNVGTDLNAIPAAAIDRIEVLRDGAAAQYGSDAIAGVINIILKKNVNDLRINITSGANMSKNSNDQTGGTDGATTNISTNYGVTLGKKGGVINFTGDFDVRDPFSRMKEWEGNIFNAYNAIEYTANKDGYNIANLLDDDISDVKKYGAQVPYFSTELKNTIANATNRADLKDALSEDTTEEGLSERSLERKDFNMRVGQSAVRGGRFFANLSLPLDDEGTELYAFSGLSSKEGNSAGFYRLPNQSRTYTPLYINGFLPEINSTVTDKSLAVGIRGKINNWNIDFSNTFGTNSFFYKIGNTSNASLQNASPVFFDAGGFSFTQNTANLDIDKYLDNVFSGLNIAFGAEYRFENYQIIAGEEASYGRYTDEGQLITIPSQSGSKDFFDNDRAGGAQVFPGFNPANELSRDRNSIAGYVDLEADITESFLISLASRFEDYSDFGSTINFKLASRIKLSENINLRAAGSTGFRAPSLHQLYFNSTSTVFIDGIPQDVATFSNDSKIAGLLGIPKLKQETSKSLSAGFTAKIPSANLSITADAYFVGIDDRVVYTGQFEGTSTEVDNILTQANASKAAFFANAIDSETTGLDIVITHDTKISNNLKLKSSLAATLSKTKQVGDIKASDILTRAGQVDTYFDERNQIFLEEAVPRTKGNLSFTLSSDKFTVFLRNVYFGEVKEASNSIDQQQIFNAKVISDLSFSYKAAENLTLTVGANNIFDLYPDRFSNESNRSGGRFDWSRTVQQFGIAGRFVFARVSFNL